jgi:hypothetical protein
MSIRNSPTLSSFKNRVQGDIYKPPKYYNEGPRKLNILHTRLRHQCSSLNADLSRIHIINNYKCNCGVSFEDAIHYYTFIVFDLFASISGFSVFYRPFGIL